MQMRRILAHPFFNLEFTVKVPIISPPPFSSLARPVELESLINRPILENLTTLFRGIPQRDIVKSLLSPEKTWEKAFYHLLKDYAERQSEEYGNEMSFLDYTGKEEPIIMSASLARNRSSVQGSGPSDTFKARSMAALVPSGAYESQLLLNTDPAPSPDPSSCSEEVQGGQKFLPPNPTRVAAPSNSSSSSHRRSRVEIGGPRPQSISEVSDGHASVSPPPPRTLPNVTEAGNATPQKSSALSGTPKVFKVPEPKVGKSSSPVRPVPQRTFTDPQVASNSNQLVPRLSIPHSAHDPTSSVKMVNPISFTQTSPDPTGNHSRIEQRLTEQRLRNANIMGTTSPLSNDAPLVGLGITLPHRLQATATHDSRSAEVASRLGVSPAGPRPAPLPKSPHQVPLPFSPDPNNVNTTVIPSESPKASPRRRATESQVTRDAPAVVFKRSSLAVPKSPVQHKEHAGYPSPPPSQVSVQETFSVFQQSPVFADRFSLNLDTMMSSFRPPKSVCKALDDLVEVECSEDGRISSQSETEKANKVEIPESLGIVSKTSNREVIQDSESNTVSATLKSHTRGSSISCPPPNSPNPEKDRAIPACPSSARSSKAAVLTSDQSNSPSTRSQDGINGSSILKSKSSQKENSPSPSQTSDMGARGSKGERREVKHRRKHIPLLPFSIQQTLVPYDSCPFGLGKIQQETGPCVSRYSYNSDDRFSCHHRACRNELVCSVF